METELRALIVDGNADAAEELNRVLRPEIVLEEVDYTNSTHKAIQSFIVGKYNLCFIAETFPMQELEVFFRDATKIVGQEQCLFVQVRNNLDPEFDRFSLQPFGFSYVISRTGNHADKEGLREALSEIFHNKEIKKRITNVNASMESILKEIDRAAEDVKRGSRAAINKIRLDFVSDQTQFDESVLTEYFEALAQASEKAAPNSIERLNIPENVLKKSLPKLDKESYTGASRRVWRKLKKHFGDKK